MKNSDMKKCRKRLLSGALAMMIGLGSAFAGSFTRIESKASDVNEYADLMCSAGGYHEESNYRALCNRSDVCSKCGTTFNNKHEHYIVGEGFSSTNVINYKAATPTTDGYSGDVYCSDCNKLLKKGHVINAYQNAYGLSNPIVTDVNVQYDTVYFGSYWQDDTNGDGVADKNDEKTPIRWKVLAVDQNKALLLSEYALDYLQWGPKTGIAGFSWEDSFARGWLNGYATADSPYDYTQDGNSFISSAFNVVERNAILTTELDNLDPKEEIESNLFFYAYTYDEYKTQDKIFPLSFDDLTDKAYGYDYISSYDSAWNYWGDDKKGKNPARITKITPFAALNGSGNATERGFESASNYNNYKAIYYGVRTNGAYVYASGAMERRVQNSYSYGLVPAMYVDLNKVNEYLMTKSEPVEEINKAVNQIHVSKVEHKYSKTTFSISIANKKTPDYILYDDTETGIDCFEKTAITLSGDDWDLGKLYLCARRGDKDVSAELVKSEDGTWTTTDSLYDDVINNIKRSDADKKSMVKDAPNNFEIKYLSSADNVIHDVYQYNISWTDKFYYAKEAAGDISVDAISFKYEKQDSIVDIVRKRMTRMTYYPQGFGGGSFGETKVSLSGDVANIDHIWLAANRNGVIISAELFADENGDYTTVSQFLDDERTGKIISDEQKKELVNYSPRDFKIVCTYKDTSNYHVIYGFNSDFIVDPSGYAYEAVESNRIDGVTATIYGSETSNGDNEFLFPAEAYGQVNPQVTGKEGFYAWDVPNGYWQVRLEKDGYNSTKSDWLPVPPPQLDVNLAMVDASSPVIENVELTKSSFEVRFNKYLKVDTVKTDAFTLTSDGKTFAVANVKALNAENGLARDYVVTLAKELDNIYTNSTYKLSVQGPVSYAGTTMKLTTMEGIKAGYAVEKLISSEKVAIGKGEFNYTVKIEPADKCALRQLTCKVDDSDILEVVKCGVVDSEGVATVTLKGKKTGVTSITLGVEGSTKTVDAVITVATNSKMLANVQKYIGKVTSGAPAKEYKDVWAEMTKKDPAHYSEKPGEYTNGSNEDKKDVTTESSNNSSTTTTAPKVGSTVKVGKAKYVIGKKYTATYKCPTSKTATSATIPASVKIKGKTYKVTGVAANAFKNNKKLKKVTIGKNVKTIGKSAFYGCKNLKTVTIKTTKLSSKTVGKNAFAKINAKAKVKVPKSKLKTYKKVLKAKGLKGKKQKVTK